MCESGFIFLFFICSGSSTVSSLRCCLSRIGAHVIVCIESGLRLASLHLPIDDMVPTDHIAQCSARQPCQCQCLLLVILLKDVCNMFCKLDRVFEVLQLGVEVEGRSPYTCIDGVDGIGAATRSIVRGCRIVDLGRGRSL